MNEKAWYRAQIRWAVMEEGKRGLREWEDAVYFLLSENEESAFQQALEIGRRESTGHDEKTHWVEKRLARIVSLDYLGANQTEFEVQIGRCRATERLPFEHEFDPAGTVPMSVF